MELRYLVSKNKKIGATKLCHVVISAFASHQQISSEENIYNNESNFISVTLLPMAVIGYSKVPVRYMVTGEWVENTFFFLSM